MNNFKSNRWSFAIAKLQAIIALVIIAVIGLSFAACDDGDSGSAV
jgi:hypothetical protein